MNLESLKELSKNLSVFTRNKCTGCDACESTNMICLDVINLQSNLNKRIKEIEEYGREHSINY